MSVAPDHLPNIAALLPLLEEAVNDLVAVIDQRYGRPNLFNIGGEPRPRYPWVKASHVRVLKAVRVVSGLYAMHSLLETGFVAESAALSRTIDDFLEEIEFLHADDNGQLNDTQQQFVDLYFDEDDRPISERLQSPRKVARIPRKKIRAHVARLIARATGNDADIHGIISQSRVVDEAFSGAVHGNYPSTMDLFGGPDRDSARFHMTGMTDTPRMPGYVVNFAIYVHRALNAVSGLAFDLGQTELFQRLQEARVEFEESDAYP